MKLVMLDCEGGEFLVGNDRPGGTLFGETADTHAVAQSGDRLLRGFRLF